MIKMKDSGIEWIGEIPFNKRIIRNKYKFSYTKGKLPNNTNTEKKGIPYIGASDLDSNKEYVVYTEDESLPECCDDDLLVLWDGARAGLSGTNKCGKISSTIVKIMADESIHPRFLYWYYKGFENYMYQRVNGTTIPHMNRKYIEDIYFLDWSIVEQQKIVNYLDEKCAKIDAIIEKQEAVIEKLKEYKLSVITEAVTKGLDNDVDMTVLSGEWVDSIPAHWKWMSLKSVTEFITCGVAATPEYTDKEFGALFLSAQNVKQGVMDYSIERYITKELHESLTKKRKPKRGDLLQVRVGASIGNVAVVDTDEEFSVYVSLTHLRCNEMIKNEFLKFCMMSPLWLQKAFSYVDFAGSQGNLNVADLRILKIPVPPINEQIDIMNYLKTKTNMIDYNIHRKEEILNRLQEYKKSLIYEVVTGKKEV